MKMKIEWTLKELNINDLKEYHKNARNMSKRQSEKLEESIEKFGLCEPIVINKDLTIIGGHQRLQSSKKLGVTQIAAYMSSRLLSEHEVEELNIRLNKNNGFFDFDVLANEFNAIDLVDWGFSLEEFEVETITENKESDNKQTKKAKMYITFQSDDDLQAAENRISTILDEYEGASYKIKRGGK